MVFANKQDLPNAMSASEITEKLGLSALRGRKVSLSTNRTSTFTYLMNEKLKLKTACSIMHFSLKKIKVVNESFENNVKIQNTVVKIIFKIST